MSDRSDLSIEISVILSDIRDMADRFLDNKEYNGLKKLIKHLTDLIQ